MVTLICEIQITTSSGTLAFYSAAEIEIERTWNTLTNTAKITLPRKIGRLQGDITKLLKAGDRVVIKTGYDVKLTIEFVGYIREVTAAVPVVIHCEDAMWHLKQLPSIEKGKTNAWRNLTLGVLTSRLVGTKYQIQTQNTALGAYRLTEKTIAKELQKLKEQTGLMAYFRFDEAGNEILTVGERYPLAWANDPTKMVAYHFQKNIIENSLSFKRKDDIKIKAKGIIKIPNGKDKTIEIGDDFGETHTVHYNNMPEAAARQLLEKDLERMKYTGYHGSFTTFGEPFAEHGFVAHLSDIEYPERAGNYYIDKVVICWGNGGYRREITLGSQAGTIIPI
ncbi:MAG: hypothetical protein RI894_1860 [Bacteroidota bacterium]|jgi:hypothetical protein